MSAIQLPADLEQRLQQLAEEAGCSEVELLNVAIEAYARSLAGTSKPPSGPDRASAHARLLERLETGWDFGGERFDRDALYDR